MATYLTGSQDLSRECRLTTAPTAVTLQTGENLDIVSWYRDTYTDLQNYVDWRWLRFDFTINTTLDDDTYAPSDAIDTTTSSAITRFGKWHVDDYEHPPRIFLFSSGVGSQTYLTWIPWEYFNQIYRIGTQPGGFPAHITVDPQDNIVIGPKPNGVYQLTAEYYRSPQILAVDGDIPEMPVQFHRLIVYEAMQHYGYSSIAAEVLGRGERMGARLMAALQDNQGPRWRYSGPFA